MSSSKRGGFKSSKHFTKKRASPEDDGEESAPRTTKRAKASEDDGTPLVPTLDEDDNKDPFIGLNKSGTRRVTVQEFKGNTLIAIREYYTDAAGELRPGKKGISLTVEQYNALLGAAPLLESVLAKKDLQVVRPEYDGAAPAAGGEKDEEDEEGDQDSDE